MAQCYRLSSRSGRARNRARNRPSRPFYVAPGSLQYVSLEALEEDRGLVEDAPNPHDEEATQLPLYFHSHIAHHPLAMDQQATEHTPFAWPGAEEHSGSEETMSDVTDETDDALIDAFEASNMDVKPFLLSLLIFLREQVVERVKARLQAPTLMDAAVGSKQCPMGGTGSTFAHIGTVCEGSGSTTTNTDGVSGSRRRLHHSGNQRSSGEEEDDDDGEVGKWQQSTSKALETRLRRFACPFYKMRPRSSNLTKSCRGPGWGSVRRVK